MNSKKMNSAENIRRGFWIGDREVFCSLCGNRPSWVETPPEAAPPYCPYCGAEMHFLDEQEEG